MFNVENCHFRFNGFLLLIPTYDDNHFFEQWQFYIFFF